MRSSSSSPKKAHLRRCSVVRLCDAIPIAPPRSLPRASHLSLFGRTAKKIAVILVGHGSKSRNFDAAMRKISTKLKRQKKYYSVSCAYLEINSPSIPEAIAVHIKNGAKEVRVLPYFLLTGRHVIQDIPEIVHEAKLRHAREAKVVLCPYLGFDPKLVKLVQERIKQIAR